MVKRWAKIHFQKTDYVTNEINRVDQSQFVEMGFSQEI